jgi:hypothetical protein
MNPADEKYAKDLISKLKSGTPKKPIEGYQPQPGQIDNQQLTGSGVETVEVPGIGTMTKDAAISTNIIDDSDNSPQSTKLEGGNICPQCKNFHPPLQPNQKCPMAPIKTASGDKLDVNIVLDKMRVILTSQLEQKSIKDLTNFTQFIIVELTKLIEGYRE